MLTEAAVIVTAAHALGDAAFGSYQFASTLTALLMLFTEMGLGVFTVCAHCHATTPVWEQSAGRGSLYSWTVVWRPPNPSFRVPYAPAVVRLDEGPWMMSAVIGCEPEALREGLPLGQA